MKITPLVLFAAAPALCAMSSAHAAAPANFGPAPGTLEVQVNVPPSWVPMLEERVTLGFVSEIDDVFEGRGFKGNIKQVESRDAPDPGCFLLTISLTEWRIDLAGNINCTFNANLQTDHTARHLGLFTDTAFRWMAGPGRFGLGRALDQAAQGAIRELYDALAKTGLVPGLHKG